MLFPFSSSCSLLRARQDDDQVGRGSCLGEEIEDDCSGTNSVPARVEERNVMLLFESSAEDSRLVCWFVYGLEHK